MTDITTTEGMLTQYAKPVTIPGPWRNIAHVKQANRDAGQFWFSPDTMRFFNSRVEGPLWYGRLFISSECREPDTTPRRYTIRAAMDDASIETVGEFQGYTTLTAAIDKLTEMGGGQDA